jgi:hypothetical protein
VPEEYWTIDADRRGQGARRRSPARVTGSTAQAQMTNEGEARAIVDA